MLPSKPVGWPGYDECETPGAGSGLPWQLQPDWANKKASVVWEVPQSISVIKIMIEINPVWYPLAIYDILQYWPIVVPISDVCNDIRATNNSSG